MLSPGEAGQPVAKGPPSSARPRGPEQTAALTRCPWPPLPPARLFCLGSFVAGPLVSGDSHTERAGFCHCQESELTTPRAGQCHPASQAPPCGPGQPSLPPPNTCWGVLSPHSWTGPPHAEGQTRASTSSASREPEVGPGARVRQTGLSARTRQRCISVAPTDLSFPSSLTKEFIVLSSLRWPLERSPEPVAGWGQGQVGWMLSSGGRGLPARHWSTSQLDAELERLGSG